MRVKLLNIAKSAHIIFLSKVATNSANSNLAIRIINESGHLVFAKTQFTTENFEYTDWCFKTSLVQGYLEINDLEGVLLLEYLVIYDSNTVFEHGVTFLRRENNGLYLDDLNSLGNYYQRNIYRPQYHFSAYKNWINDPNGLIFHNGQYHLFYQYYPHKAEWGNMHWGHAVSKDAISWRHLPIALLPQIQDEFFGGSFSGSAIVKDEQLTLIYTHHFEDIRNKIKFQTSDFIENQELATTQDGIHFTRILPPILNGIDRPPQASKDFRDPKVWLDKDNKYKMILGSSYEDQLAVLIYSSTDLISWIFEGPLYIEKNIHGRCIECPDLFPLDDKYVLIASIIEVINGVAKHVTRYHIGKYANNRFTSQYNEIIDFGPSFYAVQTFDDLNGRQGIAWLDSWQDTKKSIAGEFAGVMSLPFSLRLRGTKLQMQPLSSLEALRKLPALEFNYAASNHRVAITPDSSFELKLRLKATSTATNIDRLKIKLTTTSEQEFILIQLNFASREIFLEISEHDRCVSYCQPLEIIDNTVEMHWFFDRSALEIFFADYTLRGSCRFYWQHPLKTLTLDNPSQCAIESWELYNLKSIWENNNG